MEREEMKIENRERGEEGKKRKPMEEKKIEMGLGCN